MFENIKNIFKRNKKKEMLKSSSKDTAKERLHLVLMQDRANVSADFLDLMRREIIEVIKKYIDIDEEAMDVRLATETNEDGTQGAPALYANIPIINIKDETRKLSKTNKEEKISVEPPKKEDEEENKKEEEKEVNETKEEKTDEETELEIEEDNELVIEEELDSEKEENTKEEENAEPQEVTEEMKEEKKNEE
jgi:cell division topological specificity factor